MVEDLNLVTIVFHEASSMIHVVSYYNYPIMSSMFFAEARQVCQRLQPNFCIWHITLLQVGVAKLFEATMKAKYCC